MTVAAQIRQAARHLGYAEDDWRPRELWYARCASATAVDDLRRRHAAWQQREVVITAPGYPTLAQRVGEVRRLLIEIERQVAALEIEAAAAVDDSRL